MAALFAALAELHNALVESLSSCAIIGELEETKPELMRRCGSSVVPIFLHGNFGHVLTNVIFQMRLGFKVEQSLGRWRFLSLYLLSGTFGNLVSVALQPGKVAVGASTSAMGVLGATVVRLLCEEQGPEKQAMLISSFLILIAINLSPHAASRRQARLSSVMRWGRPAQLGNMVRPPKWLWQNGPRALHMPHK
eukprot:Skav204524  [mRNA]  locus=scaffold4461:71755:85651:- [translate_table: standard]